MKAFKLDEQQKITPGFKIPEGYFDNLTEQVMQRIEPETKVIPLYNRRKTWMFAAAAVLVLSLTIPAINKVIDTDQPEQAAIENYLAYHANFADDDIVNLLEKEDIDKIKIDYHLEEKSIEEALPADIENYLLD